MAALRSQLLKLALPLVPTHGFTRQALSLSVLSLPTPHEQPLSDTAVSSLFGQGEDARVTLINAWLDDARQQMRTSGSTKLGDVMKSRLEHNEPVLDHLTDAFALLTASTDLPIPDPRPGLAHAFKVADEACRVTEDGTTGTSWYTRRTSLAAVYGAAELHQIASPKTASAFLEELLESAFKAESALHEAQMFTNYVASSMAGIIRSRGLI